MRIQQHTDNTSIQFAMWILDNGYHPNEQQPHKWQVFEDGKLITVTENQMYKRFKGL